MYADGTGLLTDAMHAGRGLAASLPNARRHQWERLADIHAANLMAACANHSCGAVAESHRASRTFRIGTKGFRLSGRSFDATPQEKKVEFQV
jgi:hypothetical protein